jgi:hypothetical protein
MEGAIQPDNKRGIDPAIGCAPGPIRTTAHEMVTGLRASLSGGPEPISMDPQTVENDEAERASSNGARQFSAREDRVSELSSGREGIPQPER